MELTIEQALQQGVTAHNTGNLQEAERVYRGILRSHPKHPDASHNLGLIAIYVNHIETALPLFKTALQVNPMIEQFWVSYIDALVKANQLKDAKQAIKKAKKKGFDAKKLQALLSQPKGRAYTKVPSEEQLNSLQEYLQTRRYGDAESSALSITQEFPKHQFGWKVLGILYGQSGRNSEALNANQTAVELSRQDAEAHNNLGNTLKELGRLDEADASYKQAIVLKPDYAQAHSNLGNMLKELGRLDEAEASYTQAITLKPNLAVAHMNLGITLEELDRLGEAEASYTQAIALKPDYAEAHSNLGNTLTELGRLDEAEANHTQAIALKPDYAPAHSNLGATLQELGRLDEAEASYTQAIALKPDYAEALHNLSIVQSYMNNLEAEIVSLQNIMQIDADNFGLRAGVNLAICNFLEGDFADSKTHLLAVAKIQEKTSSIFKNEKVYWRYLLDILSWHEKKYLDDYSRKTDKTLYVIGESHSLVSHHLHVQSSESVILCEARLIKGCKQWHLGNSNKNEYKNKFESIFCSLPKSSEVLLAIGEIDCRLDSGIIKHKNKFPKKEIEGIIVTTVETYLTYIEKNNSDYQHKIIIQGVPCPNIDTETCSEKEVTQLIEVIKKFNCELKNKSRERGFGFLDVNKLTDRGDGFSNAIWHIDGIHLSPDGMLEAWRRYFSE
jgi:Flp pilus assembly protein TadD